MNTAAAVNIAGAMAARIFLGDITDAPAESICTSTNPRLSLMMGTGGAVRERGGFDILRECEAIVRAHLQTTGSPELPLGSAHVTTAGGLPFKRIIHCVASDARHRTSASAIRACVINAVTIAAAAGDRSLAMPVFGTGHAHYRFDRALDAMAEALMLAGRPLEVIVVLLDPAKEELAMRFLS